MKDTLRKGIGITVYATLISFVLFYHTSQNIISYADSNIPSADAKTAISLVNNLRVERNLEPLKWNSRLANAASDKATDLIGNGYFDHISPTGKTPWEFILKDGYNYKFAGENLAIDFSNVTDATVAWKNSPSHYANIVSGKYSEFGFAEITGEIDGKQSKIYVEMFGSEMSSYDRAFASTKGGSNVIQ